MATITGPLEIIEETRGSGFSQYAAIPIRFTVASIFEVREEHGGTFELVERAVRVPYLKDYDTIEQPELWAQRFDVSRWQVIGAYRQGTRVGSAVIAYGGTDVDLLEGRCDLAVLWDLRVSPEYRRQGIGKRLFDAAEVWAIANHCSELKVETQNTNVPACRFYAAQGCELRAVTRGAYTALPDEIQLLWCKRLWPREP